MPRGIRKSPKTGGLDGPAPRKATDPIERENQLIDAAVDLAEKQIRDGTAAPTVITHYLRLASTREHLEHERIMAENKLAQAKVEALQSQKHIEELYENAIAAMRSYSPGADDHD